MISNIIPFLLFVLCFWMLAQVDALPLKISPPHKRVLLLFALCILMVFAGGLWSHYEVGYDLPVFDYGTYKNIYLSPLYIPDFFQEYASAGYEIKSMEPGYLLYSSLCTLLFGSHYNLYLLFTNCILIILLYKSLRNNNIKYAYFFLLFFFASRLYLQYNFILLRQAIALSIVWAWGFPYLVKGNRGKFFLVVFSASLFHFTALLSLLALFFNRNFNVGYFIVGFAILMVLSITGVMDSLFLSLMQHGLSVVGISDGLGEKLGKYVADDDFRKLNVLTFIEAIPFGYIAIRYRKELCSTHWGRFYHNMFYVFMLLLALTMNFGFLTRACQYFIFSYFFLLAFYFQTAKPTTEKRYFLILLSCYFLIYSVRYIFIWFYEDKYSFFLLEN